MSATTIVSLHDNLLTTHKGKIREMKDILNKPDSEVEVLMLRCNKCKKVHLVSVKHAMGKKDIREAGKLAATDCTSETISLTDYRAMGQLDWCFSLCSKK